MRKWELTRHTVGMFAIVLGFLLGIGDLYFLAIVSISFGIVLLPRPCPDEE